MSSYRPSSFTRPLRPRKSGKKKTFFLSVIVIVICWFGLPYLWTAAKKQFGPRTVTVVSQDEAMKNLKGLFAGWRMSDEEIKRAKEQWEERISWINDEEAKDAARMMLAQEFDMRGMHDVSYPIIVEVLKNRLAAVEKAGSSQIAVFDNVERWGDEMSKHQDFASAEILYEMALKQPQQSESYVNLLLRDIDIKSKLGNIDGMLALMSKLHDPELLKLVKSPETVRNVADALLLEDELIVKKGGEPTFEGGKLAASLLKENNLASSSEMGQIMLHSLKQELSDVSKLSLKRNEELRAELSNMLVCFRGNTEDMVFVPEVMLSIGRLYLAIDDVSHTLLWIDRAEGVAMTMGIDTPRVLDIPGIKQEINKLRDICRERLKSLSEEQALKNGVNAMKALLAAKDWKKAIETGKAYAEKVKSDPFAAGYVPAINFQLASAYFGNSEWANSSQAYDLVLKGWNELEPDQQELLASKLDAMGYPDFGKTLHRNLAAAYAKQDMITKANAVLEKIGEKLPEPEKSSGSSGSRRSSSSRR